MENENYNRPQFEVIEQVIDTGEFVNDKEIRLKATITRPVFPNGGKGAKRLNIQIYRESRFLSLTYRELYRVISILTSNANKNGDDVSIITLLENINDKLEKEEEEWQRLKAERFGDKSTRQTGKTARKKANGKAGEQYYRQHKSELSEKSQEERNNSRGRK